MLNFVFSGMLLDSCLNPLQGFIAQSQLIRCFGCTPETPVYYRALNIFMSFNGKKRSYCYVDCTSLILVALIFPPVCIGPLTMLSCFWCLRIFWILLNLESLNFQDEIFL